MNYETLVDIFADAKLDKIPLAMSEEMLEVYKTIKDQEKFMAEVVEAYEKKKAERESHKENNTPEYQEAKKKYDELLQKYVDALEREKYLIGISIEDMETLVDLAKYGVDGNLSNFMKAVQASASSKEKVNEEPNLDNNPEKDFDREMEFDERFKYKISDEDKKMKM